MPTAGVEGRWRRSRRSSDGQPQSEAKVVRGLPNPGHRPEASRGGAADPRIRGGDLNALMGLANLQEFIGELALNDSG